MTKTLSLNMDDTRQIFAGAATIRAAILDVIDSRDIMDLWEGDMNGFGVTEDEANVSRRRFVDAVMARISDWQSTPNGGVRLENLCPRHRAAALPIPTEKICGECVNEQKAEREELLDRVEEKYGL